MSTIVPDEETPLLGGQQISAIERVTDPEPEASLSNQSSRAPSIKRRRNAYGGPDVVKKTPLPWAQFSLTLVLLLAEPLTAQVISPVSSLTHPFYLLLWRRSTPDGGIQLSAKRPFFRSLHPRSVRITPHTCGISRLTLGVTFV